MEDGLASGVAVVKSKAFRTGVHEEGEVGARSGLLGVVGGDHDGADGDEGGGGIGGGEGRGFDCGFVTRWSSLSTCSVLSPMNSLKIRRFGLFGFGGGVGLFGAVKGRGIFSVRIW